MILYADVPADVLEGKAVGIVVSQGGNQITVYRMHSGVCAETLWEGDAVLLPEHGNLIDADQFCDRFTPDEMFYPTEEEKAEYDNHTLSLREVRGNIRCEPVVVPASRNPTPNLRFGG